VCLNLLTFSLGLKYKIMNWTYFIGIDVSKLSLDICVLSGKEKVVNVVLKNDQKALQVFWKQISASHEDFIPGRIICCLEHTGIYNEHLLSFLLAQKVDICLENATHIKLSGGLLRGKSDQVDAYRIAAYAYREKDSLRLWKAPRPVITTLKHLSALRTRLINAKKSFSVPAKEIGSFDRQAAKLLTSLAKPTLRQIEKDLKTVEAKMQEIIQADPVLKRLFSITTSVSGIGPITAIAMITTTNEFQNIQKATQYACYAGIAPFEHSSGTSVRGRTRVSHKANKSVKTLLHMAALTAIQYNTEIKQYYQRKVQQGKNKLLVINAVRNKLIHRVFTCINQNRHYEKNYQNMFA
jgi:transposase